MGAAAMARQLGGTRQRHNWRCPCPCGCGYALSFCDGADGRLLVHCYGGCDFPDIFAQLVQYGLLDGDDAPSGGQPTPFNNDDADQRRRKIQQARAIYDSGVWDARIQTYLRSRGITLTSPILRFCESAPHRLGARLPAMLAPVVNASGELTGVHMTYLRLDGGGKGDLPKEFQRECRGVIRGGAIRLAGHSLAAELIIGEGIESTLSAMQIFGLAGWSAVFAGGLKTIDLPPTVRRVIIVADNDASGAGQRNALAAHDRWVVEGRTVRVKAPPDVGDDFNDVLAKRRANARH
jgi:putative DNA primase/helicase